MFNSRENRPSNSKKTRMHSYKHNANYSRAKTAEEPRFPSRRARRKVEMRKTGPSARFLRELGCRPQFQPSSPCAHTNPTQSTQLGHALYEPVECCVHRNSKTTWAAARPRAVRRAARGHAGRAGPRRRHATRHTRAAPYVCCVRMSPARLGSIVDAYND